MAFPEAACSWDTSSNVNATSAHKVNLLDRHNKYLLRTNLSCEIADFRSRTQEFLQPDADSGCECRGMLYD